LAAAACCGSTTGVATGGVGTEGATVPDLVDHRLASSTVPALSLLLTYMSFSDDRSLHTCNTASNWVLSGRPVAAGAPQMPQVSRAPQLLERVLPSVLASGHISVAVSVGRHSDSC
jgi:hypothetical protein